jgi:hypothetical protein
MLLNTISITMANFMPPHAAVVTPRTAPIDSKTGQISNAKPFPVVEVLPMPQRLEIRDGKEDWTGKTSPALRRKLQNRLNQRAARTHHPSPHPNPSQDVESSKEQKRPQRAQHSPNEPSRSNSSAISNTTTSPSRVPQSGRTSSGA